MVFVYMHFVVFNILHLLKTALLNQGTGHNCTKTKLNEGTKLHKENFSRRVNFARKKKESYRPRVRSNDVSKKKLIK